MCGQAGIIFGTRNRKLEEIKYLQKIFIYLLLRSEERGPHATGAAWLDCSGKHRIFKRPIRASKFVRERAVAELLAGLSGRTTWLAGHTRWPTRGSHLDNRNNQPLLVGKRLIGTHNGHVANADDLFKQFKLPRRAEVDSEVIFRTADAALAGGSIDEAALVDRLAHFWGTISAVMASKLDPKRLVIIKGNKPLELRYHEGYNVIAYASDPDYLDSILVPGRGWRDVRISAMSLLTFHCDDLIGFSSVRFRLANPVGSGRFERCVFPQLDETDGMMMEDI